MQYGISQISVLPVRKAPTEQSEMLTQLLFGETFEIIEENKNWTLINTDYDNYQGWINSNSITKLTNEELHSINSSESFVIKSIKEDILDITSDEMLTIPFGSSIPNLNNIENVFQIKDKKYKFIKNPEIDIELSNLLKLFLNSPYLWGGKNPFGIDCSGFTQVIFKAIGFKIPRDASQQVNLGNTVNFISDVKTGDLAFFDNEEGLITHVGIILEKNKIIHSSVKVRIDQLDQQGIYNKELKKYTHKLRVIKRIID